MRWKKFSLQGRCLSHRSFRRLEQTAGANATSRPTPKPEPAPRISAAKPPFDLTADGHGNGHERCPSPPPPIPLPLLVPPKAPVSGERKEVSVTFSLEVMAMQLTPSFRMASLQLKPAEASVAVRVSGAAEPRTCCGNRFPDGARATERDGRFGTIAVFPDTKNRLRLSPKVEFFQVHSVRTQRAEEQRR